MNHESTSPRQFDSHGWRIYYECVSPSGSRLAVSCEAEAWFWHLLGYRVRRWIQAAR